MAHDGDDWTFLGPAPRHQALQEALDTIGGSEATIRIRCGHCLNCRIRRAQEWKIRGIHEQQSTYRPTFAATLTYSAENLPAHGSLQREDLQKFHRRLRKTIGPFRFLACGEYGPNTGRAHYHGIYFGLSLQDHYRSGVHWASQSLLKTWGLGHVQFHLATEKSIGYVSGYVVKKLRTHWGQKPIMTTVDFNTGLVLEEEPVSGEFLQASNKPGLGRPWIEQYAPEVIRDGYIIINQKPCYIIPAFYQRIMRDYPGYEDFMQKRLDKASETPDLSIDDLGILRRVVEAEMASKSRDGV